MCVHHSGQAAISNSLITMCCSSARQDLFQSRFMRLNVGLHFFWLHLLDCTDAQACRQRGRRMFGCGPSSVHVWVIMLSSLDMYMGCYSDRMLHTVMYAEGNLQL